MKIEQYERLREADIHVVWKEAGADESRGKYRLETAKEHIARLEKRTGSWRAPRREAENPGGDKLKLKRRCASSKGSPGKSVPRGRRG